MGVAGLIGNPIGTMVGSFSGDKVDELLNNGIYYLTGAGANIGNVTPFGLLIVFKTPAAYTMQTFVHIENIVLTRTYNGNSWRDWKKIQFVS